MERLLVNEAIRPEVRRRQPCAALGVDVVGELAGLWGGRQPASWCLCPPAERRAATRGPQHCTAPHPICDRDQPAALLAQIVVRPCRWVPPSDGGRRTRIGSRLKAVTRRHGLQLLWEAEHRRGGQEATHARSSYTLPAQPAARGSMGKLTRLRAALAYLAAPEMRRG